MFNLLDFCSRFCREFGQRQRQPFAARFPGFHRPGRPPRHFFGSYFPDIAYTFRYGKRLFVLFSGVIIRYIVIRNSGSGILPAFSLKGIPLHSKIYHFHSAAQHALLQQKQPRQCPGCFCSGLPLGAPYPINFFGVLLCHSSFTAKHNTAFQEFIRRVIPPAPFGQRLFAAGRKDFPPRERARKEAGRATPGALEA